MRQICKLLSTISIAVVCATPALAQSVGVTAAVNQSARGTQPIRTISLGDNIIYNERITTNDVGLLQILLKDGTAFTVGPRSAITIDRFVYDPNSGTAEVAATMTRGVFRFIGGKTSKTPNGVSLNTPVGTVGVRGGVVDLDLSGGGFSTRGAGCPYPQHIDFIFGNEMTVTGNGRAPQRVYKAGYSVVTQTAGSGGSRSVVKTPPECTSNIQLALAGRPGTSGGSSQQPTNEVVAASGVSETNSDVSPAINNPPVPTPRPEPPLDVDSTVVADASRDEIRQDVVVEEPNVEAEFVPVRVLTGGTSYGGLSVENPGAVGLVGGSAEADQTANLEVLPESTTGTGTIAQGPLTLPIYNDETFTAHAITAASGATLGEQVLIGTAYSGVDGFALYSLAIDGDLAQPLYALRGTPMPDPSVFNDGDVRTYSFTPDMIQGVPAPFMRVDALGPDYGGASISDFYVVESNDGLSDPRMLQTWLSINGTGAEQTSGVGVNVGAFSSGEGGGYGAGFGRRGSYRESSNDVSFYLNGGIETLSAPGGGNEIFGANGQNMVLATEIDITDFFSDGAADGRPGEVFSTLHVLNLESEVPQSEFVASEETTRLLGDGRALNGYAAGTVEIYGGGGEGENISRMLSATSGARLSNMQLGFDGARNSLGGELQLDSPFGDTSLRIAFGDGINGNSAGGASAYLDDDKFAATRNRNNNRTYVEVRNEEAATRYYQVENRNNNTYFVSGDANPQESILPDGNLCDCKFLEWGWWGTRVRAADPATGNEIGRTSVHLGTWVAGDISSRDQVEAAVTSNVSAGYAGNAVGSVINGETNYIASGRMDMQWNFGDRQGAMQISDFDGRNFSGTLDLASGASSYDGFISEGPLGGGASGGVNGAFVNDGANSLAGTIGNFNLSTSNGAWSANGVFAGARLGPDLDLTN